MFFFLSLEFLKRVLTSEKHETKSIEKSFVPNLDVFLRKKVRVIAFSCTKR